MGQHPGNNHNTGCRMLGWFLCTVGAVICGVFALVMYIAGFSEGSPGYYAAALAFVVLTALLIGNSLRQLFHRSEAGVATFGTAYLLVLAVIAAGFAIALLG